MRCHCIVGYLFIYFFTVNEQSKTKDSFNYASFVLYRILFARFAEYYRYQMKLFS